MWLENKHRMKLTLGTLFDAAENSKLRRVPERSRRTDYKKILIPLALKAGAEIMKFYKNNPDTQFKSDNSPVTEADIAANIIILTGLAETGIPIISEESINLNYEARKKLEKFWIVDPLDGTKQFVNNEDEFTVNIALVVNNQVVEGVVFAPALNLLYYGCSGVAVKIDTTDAKMTEIALPNIKTSKTCIVASKSHLNNETKTFLTHCSESFPESETVNIGSSLKFCLVAEGTADLYPRLGAIKEWDIAAGHAVLKAAGGNVVNMETGLELTYNSETLKTPNYIALRDTSLFNKLIKNK